MVPRIGNKIKVKLLCLFNTREEAMESVRLKMLAHERVFMGNNGSEILEKRNGK